MKHLMVDLETLGTKPTCPILSIGAVLFDPVTGEMDDKPFYVILDLREQLARGRKPDGDTILWWLRQSKAAQQAITQGPSVPVVTALDDFRAYWGAARYVWSHGATFDIPILESILEQFGFKVPWKFWDARDTRTALDMAGCKVNRAEGVHHNAADDAVMQARAIVDCYKKLGVGHG